MSDETLISGPLVGQVDIESASLWVLAGTGSQLRVRYQGADGKQAQSQPKRATGNRIPLLFRLTGLASATPYEYQVEGSEPGAILAQGSFRTAPRVDQPSRFRFAVCSCMKAHAGRQQDKVQKPWQALRALTPDFQLLLGDNVYADSTKPQKLWKRHLEQRNVANFAGVIRHTPTYAVWDDHDFATSNSDGDIGNKRKQATLDLFKTVWANPSYGEPDTPGVFTSWKWGDVGFYLLDGRYHRSKSRGILLGEAQFQWLERQLATSQTSLNFIGSGSTLDDNNDGWSRFPADREHLLALCQRHHGVYLSGGRHCCGFNYPSGDQGPLVEIISSGIGRKRKSQGKHRKALQRFVVIDVDTTASPPKVTARIIGKDGSEHGSLLLHKTDAGLKIMHQYQGPGCCPPQ